MGPVVVDTGVFGADFRASSKPLADLYADVPGGRNILISFVTVAELRFGALRAGWLAATARFVGVPQVSHDRAFRNAPGVDLVTARRDLGGGR